MVARHVTEASSNAGYPPQGVVPSMCAFVKILPVAYLLLVSFSVPMLCFDLKFHLKIYLYHYLQ